VLVGEIFAAVFLLFLSTSSLADSKIVHRFVDKEIADIPIGEYSEERVLSMYGRGIPIQEGYAFCYFNRKEETFLVFEYGPDRFIQSGIIAKQHYQKNYDECKGKEITSPLQTGKGVKLGNSPESVILIYGEPDKREVKGRVLILEYHTDFSRDPQVTLAYDAYLYFEDGKLVKLIIHDGD